MAKRGEKLSERTKQRISASQKQSHASGTRRKMRTKQEIMLDRLDEMQRLMEERERRLEYLQAQEARREAYAREDEHERQRREDAEWNAQNGPKLPKGVRAIGHGRCIPRPLGPLGFGQRAQLMP
jgi:hypothetical protein